MRNKTFFILMGIILLIGLASAMPACPDTNQIYNTNVPCMIYTPANILCTDNVTYINQTDASRHNISMQLFDTTNQIYNFTFNYSQPGSYLFVLCNNATALLTVQNDPFYIYSSPVLTIFSPFNTQQFIQNNTNITVSLQADDANLDSGIWSIDNFNTNNSFSVVNGVQKSFNLTLSAFTTYNIGICVNNTNSKTTCVTRSFTITKDTGGGASGGNSNTGGSTGGNFISSDQLLYSTTINNTNYTYIGKNNYLFVYAYNLNNQLIDVDNITFNSTNNILNNYNLTKLQTGVYQIMYNIENTNQTTFQYEINVKKINKEIPKIYSTLIIDNMSSSINGNGLFNEFVNFMSTNLMYVILVLVLLIFIILIVYIMRGRK